MYDQTQIDLLTQNCKMLKSKEEIYRELNGVGFEVYARITLGHLARKFKSISHQNEKEWRLMYISVPLTVLDDNFKPIKNAPKQEFKVQHISGRSYASVNDIILPYYEYSFLEAADDNRILKEVILGYNCKVDIPTMEDFLRSNGFGNTEVKRSTIEYRS